ncbi:MAG: hypothetical protein PVI06_11685 [Desulfobacterales bacterium]|jgi:hypothetical protein
MIDRKKYQRVEILMGRIFIFVIVLAISLYVVEMVSRLFISARPPIEKRFPVQYYRQPQPYTMFSGQPQFRDLNPLGYRGKAPRIPKPEDEYRIVFLGGSTVLLGEPPISILVENIFQKNGYPRVKTYNFGVLSSVSGMELAKIVFEVQKFAPDMIVMYNGGNDILHPISWDPRPGYPFNFITYENNPILDEDINSYPTTALLMYGSNILRVTFRSYFVKKFIPLKKVREEYKYGSPAWKEKIAETYIGNIVNAAKISRTFGAEFIAFFQPLLYYKNVSCISRQEKRFFRNKEGKTVRAIRTIIAREIKEARQKYGVDIVDLSSVYSNESSWIFLDSAHTRQAAKPMIVKAIYANLADELN